MSNIRLSAVIIAKNESRKIGACLESVKWADEILVVDTGSDDDTVKIAKLKGAKVLYFNKGGYSDWRNEGKKRARGKWILYVDADERVTPELRKEIETVTDKNRKSPEYYAYAIPRTNVILGKEMVHGGWWPDYVKRLFLNSKLKKWTGDLHEEPVFEGELGHLKNYFVHIKHDNLSEMVEKTNKWSEIEAKLLLDSHHPKMSWWRFLRIMMTELWLRLIINKGFLDGPEGVIYAFYQMWSKFITYAKLWEMQLNLKE